MAISSIIIEGELMKQFRGERGLRQGDSLHPILFNIVMENLSEGVQLANLALYGKLGTDFKVCISPLAQLKKLEA